MAEHTDTSGGTGEKPGGKPRKSRLTLYIVIGIVAAITLALLAPDAAASLHLGGEIFLRLLKMVVVPLVVVSVMSGILNMGDIRKLGRPGGYTILYYLTTTLLAVAVGLVVVNVVQPGKGYVAAKQEKSTSAPTQVRRLLAEQTGLDEEKIAEALPSLEKGLPAETPGIGTIVKSLVLMLFTDNLFASAPHMDLLPLIVFSLIFAGMLTTMGRRVDTMTRLINQVNDALMTFVLLLMKVAPIGIFCLIAARFGEAQSAGTFFQELQGTAAYVESVLIGLGIHLFVTLPLIYWVFTRKNPFRFLLDMSQALLTAFSTASSSATLPVTMETAMARGGVSPRSAKFVLPLGATINMDGTALYEAVAAIFIAEVAGMDLSFVQQLVIAITATMAAIGAAGIPEAGLVTMLIVLNAVGLPIESISIILAVDWFLDRFRTAVNVAGDSIGAAVVSGAFPADGEAGSETG